MPEEKMPAAWEQGPAYGALHTWDNYSAQLLVEYEQSLDEGKDIAALKELFQAAAGLPETKEKADIADALYRLAHKAPTRQSYAYREPSDYGGISRLAAHRAARPAPEAGVLRERVRGAWYGRICGCLLGKPIEGFWKSEMLPLLKGSGNWPLHGYIEQSAITPALREQFNFDVYHRCYADTVGCAPADDDTNYTVLASELIERYGRDFTPGNVAELWVCSQPKSAYCTAERVAFRNFVNGYLPPASAAYKNPYREWIGAQIRGDYFGYINPGDPAAAAAMAWRDASVSHTKNGIYGEMFVAGMLAWAAVSDDAEDVIGAGLDEIPSTSRLYESISRVVSWKKEGAGFDEVIGRIEQRYDDTNLHHWDHTVSNAMIVTAALLYGGGGYGRSICLAVQSAFDTDCNGATVGSVVGMMKGFGAIEPAWTEPVHGLLETDILGVGKIPVETLVDRTLKHAQKA